MRNVIFVGGLKKGEDCIAQLDCYRRFIMVAGADIYHVNQPRNKKLEKYFNTYIYIDLCCKSILQYVIQVIIKNKKNTKKLLSIKKMNKVILEFLEEECKLLQHDTVKLHEAPKKNLLKIYSFYFIRDRFLQDTKILKSIYIKNDMRRDTMNFIELEGQVYTWDKVQNLFERGSKCELKTFKRNLANCFLLIKKINWMSMENVIPCDPVHLRALYHGIYLNKSYYTSKRKTSMTIANKFIKTNNIEASDYYFIRELLNMGLLKEYGLLEEFYAKNELQENLYHLVCLYLAKLEPINILAKFYILIKEIKQTIYELDNECNDYEEIQIESDKNIDNSLPSDYADVSDGNCIEIYQRLEKLFNIDKI